MSMKTLADTLQKEGNDMKIEPLLPLFGIVFGWFLNESSQRYKKRKDEKKSLAKALAELLEIRHTYIKGLQSIENFKIELDIPDEFWPFIRQAAITIIFNERLINREEITKRYNSAVDSICEIDPLLGFNLRDKDVISSILNFISKLMNEDGNENVDDYFVMLDQLINTYSNLLDDTIILISKKYSWVYAQKVKNYLKKNISETEDYKMALNETKKLLANAFDKLNNTGDAV